MPCRDLLLLAEDPCRSSRAGAGALHDEPKTSSAKESKTFLKKFNIELPEECQQLCSTPAYVPKTIERGPAHGCKGSSIYSGSIHNAHHMETTECASMYVKVGFDPAIKCNEVLIRADTCLLLWYHLCATCTLWKSVQTS